MLGKVTLQKKRAVGGIILGLGLVTIASSSFGQETGAGVSRAETHRAILSNESYLRTFFVFMTPLVITSTGEIKPALDPRSKEGKPLPDYQSPLPPANWFDPQFDDTAWDRTRPPVEIAPGGATGHRPDACHTATPNSLICTRGKFEVQAPERAGTLRLTLEYVGGAVVYLNGQEVVRGHLPPGPITPDTLAEKYPDDLYCEPDGMYLADPKKNPAGFERRYRRLTEVRLPSNLLRKGVNVLAVEIHRAPINEPAVAAKRVAWPGDGMYTVPGMWPYAGLRSLSLTTDAEAAAVPNVGRPEGTQVWNVPVFATVTAMDYGDPGDPLPVKINTARNGVFSGRLVVSSPQPIKGLKVSVDKLKARVSGATLPSSTLKIRYAEPATPEKCWTPPDRFNGLIETIPTEIPVTGKGPNAGAVASLWFTVRTVPTTKAGMYEGVIKVEAEGLPPTRIPLLVTVYDWCMPDPKDFRQHHLIFSSPDAVAKHYGVPLWSDRHFYLMRKTLELLAEVNSREVALNLAIDFYGLGGNEEALVRWVKQPDGSFQYDFSIFDKYLDLVAQCYGKPFPLRLNCWGESNKEGKNTSAGKVSVLDPTTGKVEQMEQPPFGTIESLEFWRPVISEVLKRIEKRGWLDVTGFGHNSYCYSPKPQVIDIAKKLWPDGVWIYTAHNGRLGEVWKGTEPGVAMPVKYSVCIWTEGRLVPRGYRTLLGPRPGLWCNTGRTRHRDWSPLIVIRNLPEEMIQRGHDGVGDFGADLFPVKAPNGRLYCVGNGRGTGGPDAAQRAILAPGPDGAVSTERFENFREGTELGEALLYLENALVGKKIQGELEQKVSRYLDRRAEVFIRYWYERRSGQWDAGYRWTPPGLMDLDAQLLELCAEVSSATQTQ
ncbi:MAG: glycoside hydrolase domain-containing protein [Kiritimatiellia bacterium]